MAQSKRKNTVVSLAEARRKRSKTTARSAAPRKPAARAKAAPAAKATRAKTAAKAARAETAPATKVPKKLRAGSPPSVTIFGAGIAGMTAAHELVERGFQVEVWECEGDERAPSRGCAVGGMARTQWSAVPWPEQFSDAPPRETVSQAQYFKDTQAGPIQSIDAEIYVGKNAEFSVSVDLVPGLARSSLTDDLVDAGAAGSCVYAECLFTAHAPETTDPKRDERARELVPAIMTALGFEATPTDSLLKLRSRKGRCGLQIRAFQCPPGEGFPPNTQVLIRFRKRERWLPGEHGYRFFPSFYSHLFETMARTPLLEPQLKTQLVLEQERADFRGIARTDVAADPYTYVETGKTVFDNLVAAKSHALAFNDGYAPLSFPRYRVGSLAGVLRQWRTAMEKLDYAPRDLARFALRIQEFAMMSPERRTELEKYSWSKFVGAEDPGYYSPNFKRKMEQWTEGLVAMSMDDCDARTYGTIILQLLSDQYRTETSYRDGILNGPTSDVWLDPWRRYLEAQGVRFIHGKLEGLEFVGNRLRPVVSCFEPRYPGANEGKARLLDGYYVLALPVHVAQEMAASVAANPAFRAHAKQKKAEKSPKERIATRDIEALAKFDIGDLNVPRPSGVVRHFAGIQFYFRDDVPWVQGHIYYPDAPWGLSSISQARFWQQKRDWEHGYRGIISVIIGRWDARSPATKQTAWESNPEELAQEVWRQLKEALKGPNDPRLGEVDSDEMEEVPDPIYWRLDAHFAPNEEAGVGDEKKTPVGYKNETPLLINRAGDWQGRPGDLPVPSEDVDEREEESERNEQREDEDGEPDDEARQDKEDAERAEKRPGYSVCDRIVLAGTYMKTFTRLTTMEAANESGRHAVNAILTDLRLREKRRSKLCKIYPIEHREPADFALLKDIDAKLSKLEADTGGKREPSLVRALGLDRWTAWLPRRRS